MSSRRVSTVVLLATLALAALVATPASAADDDPDLLVSIEALTPSVLDDDSTVVMAGTVTNRDDHAWTDAKAYLVIPRNPFRTRAQIDEAIGNGNAYTGSRVTRLESIADLGTLAPKASVSFSLRVPHDALGISDAEGVYPVGVQVLGTDTDGTRSSSAIGRATTFVPLVESPRVVVPTSIVWPFVMPDARGVDGRYLDSGALLTSVTPGGALRHLLDLASSTPPRTSTILLDPALLVGVRDLAEKRRLTRGVDPTDEQVEQVEAFRDDLLAFARTESLWVLDYDRPDDLALAQHPDLSRVLSPWIRAATSSALTEFQLSGRRASWPTADGVTPALLRSLRRGGDNPVVVTRSAVPEWDLRLGSVVQYDTPRGPMPLLVDEALDAGVPGRDSVVTLRQRLLSEAALAAIQRTVDEDSRADAVTVVDPRWDPGADWAGGRLSEAFDAPFTTGVSVDDLLTQPRATYDGAVSSQARARPLSRAHLERVAALVDQVKALDSVLADSATVAADLARDVAGVLGVRWRGSATVAQVVEARGAAADRELEDITIEGPPSLTLSSSKGAFPLTISNDGDREIRVGVVLSSSNPALRIPDVDPVDVAAGERRTLTVDIDLERQNTTTVTARLTSGTDVPFGDPAVFNVRSSSIGVVLWVAMGLAGLLILVAIVRRVLRRRATPRSEPLADDDV